MNIHRPLDAARSPARTALVFAGLFVLLMLAAQPAHAALGNAFTFIGQFEEQIVQRATAVANSAEVNQVATTFFTAMALGLFMMKALGWGLRGFRLDDLWETIMEIAICGFLMGACMTILPAFFEGALFIGQSMISALAGVNMTGNQAASLPTAMVDLFHRFGGNIVPNCGDVSILDPLDCVVHNIVAIIASLIITITLVILCVVILVVDVWGFWLFAIALVLVKILIPFMLYKRLMFLFLGWQRFFFGTLVYVLLARINLALVAFSLFTFLNLSVASVPNGTATITPPPPITGFGDVAGMLLFFWIGIFTLLSTGRFAQAMISGAGGGGVNFKLMAGKSIGAVASGIDIYKTAKAGWNSPKKVGDEKTAEKTKNKDYRSAKSKQGKGSGSSGGGGGKHAGGYSSRHGAPNPNYQPRHAAPEKGGSGGGMKDVYSTAQYKKAGFGGMMLALHHRAEKKHSSYRKGSNVGKSAHMGMENGMALGVTIRNPQLRHAVQAVGMVAGGTAGLAGGMARQFTPGVKAYDPYKHDAAQKQEAAAYERNVKRVAKQLEEGGIDDAKTARSAAEDLISARQSDPYSRLNVQYDRSSNTYRVEKAEDKKKKKK